jgi:hypothetical protein
MAVKPDGGLWTVREQIIEDPASGLTFQFELMPDGEPRFRVFGKALPFGNREIIFDKNGVEGGAGTVAAGLCRPAWLDRVDL